MTAKKRILVVDDEPAILELIKIRLVASGFEVLTAEDGLAGLEKAKAENPDLILLDVMMPKMDGYQVCRFLKFDEAYKHIPVIMLTARSQKTDTQTGQSVGADGFIRKPFEPAELLTQINSLLK